MTRFRAPIPDTTFAFIVFADDLNLSHLLQLFRVLLTGSAVAGWQRCHLNSWHPISCPLSYHCPQLLVSQPVYIKPHKNAQIPFLFCKCICLICKCICLNHIISPVVYLHVKTICLNPACFLIHISHLVTKNIPFSVLSSTQYPCAAGRFGGVECRRSDPGQWEW